MIFCNNREYRCHFCDEDFYYGKKNIDKSKIENKANKANKANSVDFNNQTNFIGKKKDFLLHLIEFHDDRIIDFHEKIPKDEKFRYYNNYKRYGTTNSNSNNIKTIHNNIDLFGDENIINYDDSIISNNNEDKKQNNDLNISNIKEEEKDDSISQKKEFSKPLIPRSDNYYAFLEKMKLFELPSELKIHNTDSNTTNNNSVSNNVIKNVDIDKNIKTDVFQYKFNPVVSKNKNYDNILDFNRKYLSNRLNNNLKKNINHDKESIINNYSLQNEKSLDEYNEIKLNEDNLDPKSNNFYDLDNFDCPEIYKMLSNKKNIIESKGENAYIKNNIKDEKNDDKCSFSDLLIENYTEEDENYKKQVQKILDDMQKFNFDSNSTKKDNKEKNSPNNKNIKNN